jgi:hypothetical protein
VIVAAVAMMFALPATAASTTPRLADKKYVTYHLVRDWRTFDGENISYARCSGDWSRPHKWQYHEWFFHAFKCREQDDVSRVFAVAVTIGAWNGKDSLHVVEYGCSDIYSRYYCPTGLPSL